MNIRAVWFRGRGEAVAKSSGEAGVTDAAHTLLRAANERVPMMTGALKESGMVEDEPDGARVGYATSYAHILHAHPEWSYENGGSGTWLDDAIEQDAAAVGDTMAASMKAHWP